MAQQLTFTHDGQEITTANRLSFTVNADENEISDEKAVILSIEEGYVLIDDVELELDGASSDKFQMGWDALFNDANWGENITLPAGLTGSGSETLYVRARAVDGESAQKDISTMILVVTPNSAISVGEL